MSDFDTPDPVTVLGIPERIAGAVAPAPPADMRETAEERAERAALSRKHRRDRYLRNLPKRYASASLADLTPEQDRDGKVSGWLDSGHQTLLLASQTPGNGKTHAAYAVGSQAVNEAGLIAEAYDAVGLLAALRPNPVDAAAPQRVLEDVLTCDLLVLDDLGREVVTDWAQERIHHVLHVRLANHLRTIITTNLTAAQMSERYGFPTVDRILDDAVVVKVLGESRRRMASW